MLNGLSPDGQYFFDFRNTGEWHMPITKTGSGLLKLAGAANAPGTPGFGSKALSALNRFSMPLFNVGIPAMNIASGTSSVGEAVGESAGGLAGWRAADKLVNRLPKLPYVTPALRFLSPVVGSMIGGSAGGSVLGTIAPIWKRQPPTIGEYNYGNQ